nr:MAG TPA_asm: tail assembly chaperone [Caudoviricetes sp.]
MALPYSLWKVSEGKELRLRLNSQQASKVEEKIGMNLLKVFMPDGDSDFVLPPLKVMLLLTQASLQKYENGYSIEDVYDLFDEYVDNGGDQTTFMTDVLIPLFEVSGFTPREKKAKKAKANKSTLTVVE